MRRQQGGRRQALRIAPAACLEPRSGGEAMVRDFKTRVFPDTAVRLLTTAPDGKKSVGVV